MNEFRPLGPRVRSRRIGTESEGVSVSVSIFSDCACSGVDLPGGFDREAQLRSEIVRRERRGEARVASEAAEEGGAGAVEEEGEGSGEKHDEPRRAAHHGGVCIQESGGVRQSWG